VKTDITAKLTDNLEIMREADVVKRIRPTDTTESENAKSANLSDFYRKQIKIGKM